MVKKSYVPKQGDVIWLDLDPTLGHEQKGRRPAIVVSSQEFNVTTGMVYICPITNTNRDYVFRIPLEDQKITGYVMVDQLRSLDWKARRVELIDRAGSEVMQNVLNCVQAVLDL